MYATHALAYSMIIHNKLIDILVDKETEELCIYLAAKLDEKYRDIHPHIHTYIFSHTNTHRSEVNFPSKFWENLIRLSYRCKHSFANPSVWFRMFASKLVSNEYFFFFSNGSMNWSLQVENLYGSNLFSLKKEFQSFQARMQEWYISRCSSLANLFMILWSLIPSVWWVIHNYKL